jgi:hypothetical protein
VTPASTASLDLLRRALRERLQVLAIYDGHAREFCPHVLGTTEGEARCLGYQFGGAGSRGPITPATASWRCFRVDGLGDVRLREGAWHADPRPRGPQTCVREVELEVEG